MFVGTLGAAALSDLGDVVLGMHESDFVFEETVQIWEI